MNLPLPKKEILDLLSQGVVIPATPLALTENKQIDKKYQKALYHYYIASGSGGLAIGVHTTQFEIHHSKYDLYKVLLEFAKEVINQLSIQYHRPVIKIAGICGNTRQAIRETKLAQLLGYDLGLLSLADLNKATEDELIQHSKEISKIIPLMGFYIQPAVGGRILSYTFWRKFAEIENVIAIKIAPFNRYYTLDVIRAVAHSGRENQVHLYTGNDDNIIPDLITPYPIHTKSGTKMIRIKGGLLGQWAVWTKKAVELLNEIHSYQNQKKIPIELLNKHIALLDANSVIFDTAHDFKGCIPGIHEILRRQGLLRNLIFLDDQLSLSNGQFEEIDRIENQYPWLNDNEFIKINLDNWLKF